ncbi:MAG: TetR/AcrR family transcriptional regulator [Candidatus Bipolaricaulota bacterium]
MSVEAEIRRAAARLFAEHGFHETGMRAIAAAAGVSIGALYHYFASKEEIFLAVLRQGYDRRLEEAQVLWREGLPVPEVLRRVVELHFASIAEGHESGRLVSRAWLGEVPSLRSQILALREEYARCIADLLSQAMARGEIRSAHPLLTAYALLGLVEAVTARAVAGDDVAQELRREGPRELAEIAWRALRPEKEES